MNASIHVSSGRYFSIMRFITASHPQRSVENVPSKSHTTAFIGLVMSAVLYLLRELEAHTVIFTSWSTGVT